MLEDIVEGDQIEPFIDVGQRGRKVAVDDLVEHARGRGRLEAVLTSDLKSFALPPFKMYATWGIPPRAECAGGLGGGERPATRRPGRERPLPPRFTAPRPAAPHPLKRWVPEAVWPLANHLRLGGRR